MHGQFLQRDGFHVTNIPRPLSERCWQSRHAGNLYQSFDNFQSGAGKFDRRNLIQRNSGNFKIGDLIHGNFGSFNVSDFIQCNPGNLNMGNLIQCGSGHTNLLNHIQSGSGNFQYKSLGTACRSLTSWFMRWLVVQQHDIQVFSTQCSFIWMAVMPGRVVQHMLETLVSC